MQYDSELQQIRMQRPAASATREFGSLQPCPVVGMRFRYLERFQAWTLPLSRGAWLNGLDLVRGVMLATGA